MVALLSPTNMGEIQDSHWSEKKINSSKRSLTVKMSVFLQENDTQCSCKVCRWEINKNMFNMKLFF